MVTINGYRLGGERALPLKVHADNPMKSIRTQENTSMTRSWLRLRHPARLPLTASLPRRVGVGGGYDESLDT